MSVRPSCFLAGQQRGGASWCGVALEQAGECLAWSLEPHHQRLPLLMSCFAKQIYAVFYSHSSERKSPAAPPALTERKALWINSTTGVQGPPPPPPKPPRAPPRAPPPLSHSAIGRFLSTGRACHVRVAVVRLVAERHRGWPAGRAGRRWVCVEGSLFLRL